MSAKYTLGDRVIHGGVKKVVLRTFVLKGKDIDGNPASVRRYVVYNEEDRTRTETSERFITPFVVEDNPFGEDYEDFVAERNAEMMADLMAAPESGWVM